jgi:hypothetical protein
METNKVTDTDDVARWMASRVETVGFLYQDVALAYIAENFGNKFVETSSGHPAIAKPVLDSFHRLTQGLLIWDRWDKCWRHRDLGYPPGPAGPHDPPIN